MIWSKGLEGLTFESYDIWKFIYQSKTKKKEKYYNPDSKAFLGIQMLITIFPIIILLNCNSLLTKHFKHNIKI